MLDSNFVGGAILPAKHVLGRVMKFKALALAAITSLFGLSAEALEVRFYPGGTLYSYELDQAHSASSLLIHNIAIINDGSAPVNVAEVQIQLLAGGRVLDLRTLDKADLQRAALQGSQLQQAGMIEPLAFMFGGEKLLPAGTKLPQSTTLAPGEAIIISTQLFGYRGLRDELRVRAIGDGTVREISRPISSKSSETAFALPLNGVWMDGSGSSLHTPHRWVPMEQFAHDLLQLGPDHRTHKGDGTKFTDYYAYGKPVLAPAAGTVIAASDTETEDPGAMRQKGEALDAYFQRLQGDQMVRLSKGLLGIVGNYVVIDHGNGEFSLYAHLKPKSVKVKTGQRVAAGTVLGAVGSSGNSTEPHLHFQVCDGPDPLMCAGIPTNWKDVTLTFDDFPRALQSGDLIHNVKPLK